jgi:predicted PurR-regulated permease PerM
MRKAVNGILLEMSIRRPPLIRSGATPPTPRAGLRARRVRPAGRWFDWDSALLGLLVVGFGALLWLLSPILAPFLAAAILAYIFAPLVARLKTHGVPRALGTVIALLVLLLAVLLLILIVMPLFYREIEQLVQQFPGFVEKLKTSVIPWVNEKAGVAITLDSASLRQFIAENATDASGIARKIFATVGVGGLAVVGFLINLMLIPVVLFYVLRDWNILIANIDAAIPRRLHATVTTIACEIDAVLSEFLRGQLSVMLIMSIFYVAGLWLAGLNFALPVGLITGLLVFVPYLGSGTGLLLGTVAAVMQDPSIVAVVWVVFAVGQLIEGFAVTPWLVGDRIGLHPVAVLFALLAFGQVFGFFGVLLALPASAAILVGLRHLQARYRRSSLYQG